VNGDEWPPPGDRRRWLVISLLLISHLWPLAIALAILLAALSLHR
jgi:hypothetical protein